MSSLCWPHHSQSCHNLVLFYHQQQTTLTLGLNKRPLVFWIAPSWPQWNTYWSCCHLYALVSVLALLNSASRISFLAAPSAGMPAHVRMPVVNTATPPSTTMAPAAPSVETHSLRDVTDTCSGQGLKLNLSRRCLHHMKAGFNASLTNINTFVINTKHTILNDQSKMMKPVLPE